MSFIDADQGRRTKPIFAVAALHALIAYGFISGLAYEVFPYAEHPLRVRQYPDDPPPPLPKEAPPPRAADRQPNLAPVLNVDRPALGGEEVILVPSFEPADQRSDNPPVIMPKVAPVRASQARGATVIGDRAAWVTADDYPPAALRLGVEGTVGIAVTVAADGRIAACEVTVTSGDASLDQATCRIYARRARFTPALDDEGRPVAAHRSDRVRWRLPAE